MLVNLALVERNNAERIHVVSFLLGKPVPIRATAFTANPLAGLELFGFVLLIRLITATNDKMKSNDDIGAICAINSRRFPQVFICLLLLLCFINGSMSRM
jgi:hypothetical protein